MTWYRVKWSSLKKSSDDVELTHSDEEYDKGEHKDQEIGGQFLVHNPRIPWNRMEPHLVEKYESPEQFKLCLTNYAVANGYQLRCWAYWMGNELTWQVKSLEKKHVCAQKYSLGSLITPSWIANHYLSDLIRNPKTKVKEMKADFLQRYSLKLSKVLRSNPGSTVEIGVDVNPDAKYFKRIYICLKALKEGWLKGCRKVIDLDGCFLKGKVKGELLAAICRDGNNQIYPIAWAVVNVENKDNWKWFIELLQSNIKTVQGNGLTLISDQHKGLLEAVKEVMPHAEHRQCAHHICANFYKRFSGEIYKTLFWQPTKSIINQEFKNSMEKMKELNNDAYDDLMKRNPKTWCRAYFETDRACEVVENGMFESFNSSIIGARGKPLITMLKEIRLHVMERNWIVIPSVSLLEVRNGYEGYMVDLEATSGGRGGKEPIGARGKRGSSAGTSGGGGGRSLIDEIFDSPMENEVIDMFDNFEEELRRAKMERREGEPLLQFLESQFDEGVPITQYDGVVETQYVVPETQFDIENEDGVDEFYGETH
ncbi:unnamed protein product [Lactuca saligna]|uniref:MULE transposase domain-containing protein n=1 Tax=Lactuca saligna TaxID=75948 RepID=A0AA35YL97_LACSI|nr:unnamed protein product [Lactuca saligna]